jgi:hypothetical protein
MNNQTKSIFLAALILLSSGCSVLYTTPGGTPRVEVPNQAAVEVVDKIAKYYGEQHSVEVNGNRVTVSLTNFAGTARFTFNVMETPKGSVVTVSKTTQIDPAISYSLAGGGALVSQEEVGSFSLEQRQNMESQVRKILGLA